MKILFLNIYQNKVARGAERFVYELGLRLKKNHQVDIISSDKVPVRRWPFVWRSFLDPQGIQICLFTLKSLSRIWREKYDIVIPLNGGWQPAWVRLVTWLYGGKVVISGQSGMGWDDRNNLWSFPNAFVALSGKAKGWARKVNPLVKASYIPNGVDTTKFKPEGPSIGTNLKKPIVVCQGALTKGKRIDLTIKAVAKLGDASLLVVGDGELKEEINKLGNELLGDRFQLIKAPFEDMPKVYRVGDVFTLPSEAYHSFEIALVEAMASGLPVVANSDDIRRQIVGRAGVLVDPTNIDAYAIALENALRLKWGRRPQNQAKKFDWDKIAVKYEQLFESLLK